MRQKITKKYEKLILSLGLDEVQESIIKSTWLDYFSSVNLSAKRGWIVHNYTRGIVFTIGLLIPIIESSGLNKDICNYNITIVSVLGVLIAGLAAINRQIGFEEKWKHYRATAEFIRNEGDDYFALAGKYSSYKSHKDAFKKFISEITDFKRKEVETYFKIEKDRKNRQN